MFPSLAVAGPSSALDFLRGVSCAASGDIANTVVMVARMMVFELVMIYFGFCVSHPELKANDDGSGLAADCRRRQGH